MGHPAGVLVLGERDCSVQRRHQKVVEESPAPGLPDKTRAALHRAAHAAAAAIDYQGAGTVEFLYDAEADRFFFLEMNTRLQVEHPVTELVHGVDLVELQLTVAEGRSPDPRTIGETYGHAIEVRLYAEDPAADWAPQSGVLTLVEVPGVDGEFDLLNRPGLRLDAGVETGSEVSTHYDAMLAKVIVLGAHPRAGRPSPGRGAARCPDPRTRHQPRPARRRPRGSRLRRRRGQHRLPDRPLRRGRASRTRGRRWPRPWPWPSATAPRAGSSTAYRSPGATWSASPSARCSRQARPTSRWSSSGTADARVRRRRVHGRRRPTADRVVLERDGVRTSYDVAVCGDAVDVDSATGHVRLTVVPRFTDPADAVASGSLLAPMPGTVVRVAVAEG